MKQKLWEKIKAYVRRNQSVLSRLLVIMGLLILLGGVLYLQLSFASLTSNQQVILKVFEATLLIAIGYQMDIIASRGRLRDYAHGALRRIRDIQNTTERLRGELARLENIGEANVGNEITATSAIANELDANVKSSVIDWLDFIDNDIDKLQELFDLEDQKRELIALAVGGQEGMPDQVEKRLEEIERKIRAIRSSLPIGAERVLEPVLEATSAVDRFAVFTNAHLRLLNVMNRIGRISIGVGGCPEDVTDEELTNDGPFELWPSAGAGRSWYDVKGASGKDYGVWEKDRHFGEDRYTYENTVLEFLGNFGLVEQLEGGGKRLVGSNFLRRVSPAEFQIAIPRGDK